MIFRLLILVAIACQSQSLQAHHWVSDVYDENTLMVLEVVVQDFRFINPHPFVSVVMSDADDDYDIWTLEMDNRWELAALGFTQDTLRKGDLIRIGANPSPFNDRALYIRIIEHPRLNFRYEHNVRELFELNSL